MRFTKFFVSVLLIVEISCVCAFGPLNVAVQEIGHQDGQARSTNVEWICTSDADCTTAGSSCVNERCQCSHQYVFNAAMTSCLKAATNYGDTCEETSQCTAYLKAGGFCNNGKCTCSKGYHYLHGRCRKSSALNEKCRADDDCYVNFNNGAFSCKNEVCVCRDGYYQQEYRTCRLEAKESGAECTIDMDCTYDKNAKCDQASSKCFLKLENKTSKVELRGLKNKAPKSSQDEVFGLGIFSRKRCTSDKDCEVLGEALCDSTTGMCTCKPGHFSDPTMPRCNPELGEKCIEGEINIIMNSTCRFGQWSCMGSTVPSKNNRICRKATTSYAGYCLFDEQCYVFGPDASCIDQTCRCRKDTHYSYNHKFCSVNKGIGETCVIDEDCYVPGFGSQLDCNAKSVCTCRKDTHLNAAGTACVKDVPILGDACSAHVDCKGLKNSKCTEGFCSCAPYYFEMSGECVNGNYAPCIVDNDCKTENSICDGKRCNCADPYVPVGTDLCVQGVSFGGSCQNDAECQVNTTKSYCNSTGSCDCQANHLYYDYRCREIKNFDDKCDWVLDVCWDEYHPDSMECNIRTCRCKQGFKPSYNWIYCEKEQSNAAPKYIFMSWFGLTMFSALLMGFQ